MFLPFSHFWVCLGFVALCGHFDPRLYRHLILNFFGQNFKSFRNSVFRLSNPTNIKFTIFESRFRAIAVTNINFLAIFRTFRYFWLLGYFCLRLYWWQILNIFGQNFKICQNWVFSLSNPLDQKLLSFYTLKITWNDIFMIFWPFLTFSIFWVFLDFGS